MISMSASIITSPILPKISGVKFRSNASPESVLVGRPSLMLPPIEGEKVKYSFYSPLLNKRDRSRSGGYELSYYEFLSKLRNKEKEIVRFDNRDVVRFDNRGGKEEADLVKGETMVGSSHGWMVLDNEAGLCLINPLSGRTVHLPPYRGQPFLANQKNQDPIKVILSHSPDDQECRALAIHGSYFVASLCSLSKGWTPLDQGQLPPGNYQYHDAAYSALRKTFLCAKVVTPGFLTQMDDLEFWDPSSTMEAPVKTLTTPCYSIWSDPSYIWRTYLVVAEGESDSGQLFLVRRYMVDNEAGVEYKVYSIDNYFGCDVVKPCDSLNGLVMFIGLNHGFAVKASKYPEYKPNCIYFSGVWLPHCQADIYDYNNKSLLHDIPTNHMLPWFTLTKD